MSAYLCRRNVRQNITDEQRARDGLLMGEHARLCLRKLTALHMS